MSFVYDKHEYAASTWTLEQMPLHQALIALNAHEVNNIEIWADTVHLDPRLNPDISQVKRWLKEYCMRAHSIHAPFRNYDNRPMDDTEFCRFRTENIKKTVDYAEALDCQIVVVHALDRNEYNYPNSQLSIVQDYIGEIAEHGRRHGVQIAIEDIPPGNGKDEIFTSLSNQKKLFAGLGIKYCLDIGHVPLLGANMFEEIDAAGSDLITLHIHNNSGFTDDHNLLNDGILDWPRIHDYLRESGYKGEFVLELFGGLSVESELNVLDRTDALYRG